MKRINENKIHWVRESINKSLLEKELQSTIDAWRVDDVMLINNRWCLSVRVRFSNSAYPINVEVKLQ